MFYRLASGAWCLGSGSNSMKTKVCALKGDRKVPMVKCGYGDAIHSVL